MLRIGVVLLHIIVEGQSLDVRHIMQGRLIHVPVRIILIVIGKQIIHLNIL